MQVGDAADKLYIVLRGHLQVSVGGKVVDTKKSGDAFGELAMLSDETRTADVLATTRCELATLHRADYQRVVQTKTQSKKRLSSRLVASCPLFANLSEEARADLSAALRLQPFAAGDVLMVQGTQARADAAA